MCLCVSMDAYIHTHIHIHTWADTVSLVPFFHKNKSFKAVYAYKFSFIRALHWIAKYLRDLILLEIHTVCRLYICVCVYMRV